MTPIETHVNKRWQLRMTLVAFGFAVFAAWFAYDGAVGYPAFNERAQLHNQLVVDEARRSEWLALADEKAWPPVFDPEVLDHEGRVKLKSGTDMRVQIGLAVFCLLAVAAIGLRIFFSRRSYMVLDDEGLLTFAGERVPYASMLEVDRRRWERKSVAVLHYADDKGRRRKVVLDDWIHEGMEDILKRIEHALPEPSPAAPAEPAPMPEERE